jgi:opacity protein-like surface antigen
MSKRIIGIAACLVVLFSMAAFAQMKIQPGIAVGVTNFSEKYSGSGVTITPDSRMGFSAGAVLDIGLMDLISIEPGLFYTTRGMKMENSGTTFTENLSYLSVPVHVKVKFTSPVVKPYALAGLNLGLLMSAKDKVEGGGATAEQDIKDSANSVDMGLDFGVGVDFALPALTPFVEFVYYVGLMDLPKDLPSGVSVKSNGWEIKGGLKFKM